MLLIKRSADLFKNYRPCEDDEYDQAFSKYAAYCRQDGPNFDMPSRSCCNVESGKLFLCNNYRTLAIFHIKPAKSVRGFSLRRCEQQSEIAHLENVGAAAVGMN